MYKNALVILSLIVATAALSVLVTKGVSAQTGATGQFTMLQSAFGAGNLSVTVLDTQSGDVNFYNLPSSAVWNQTAFAWASETR